MVVLKSVSCFFKFQFFRGIRKWLRICVFKMAISSICFKRLPNELKKAPACIQRPYTNFRSCWKSSANGAEMAAEMENDWRESVRKLAQAHDVSARKVHAALRVTWSAQRSRPRWATKRFSFETKRERFRTCKVAKAMASTVLWQF